jgi:uncharacterized protein
MSRLFFLIAIVLAIYLLIRRFGKNAAQQDKPAAPPAAEDMVRCAQCGVHLPKSESFLEAGNFFCSVAHRDAYRK